MHSGNTTVDNIENIGWVYYAWYVSIIIDNSILKYIKNGLNVPILNLIKKNMKNPFKTFK